MDVWPWIALGPKMAIAGSLCQALTIAAWRPVTQPRTLGPSEICSRSCRWGTRLPMGTSHDHCFNLHVATVLCNLAKIAKQPDTIAACIH